MADGNETDSNQDQHGYFKNLWDSTKRQSKDIKFFMEIAALLVVGCYTFYAHQQATAAIKAANAAKQGADAASGAASTAAQAFQDSKDSFQKTLDQMIGQTTAQGKAADAAIQANKITRETLTSVQRAFISFAGVATAEKTVVENNRTAALTLALPWLNEGATPTRRAEGRVNWIALPSGLPDKFAFADQGPPVQPRQFYVAPKNLANGSEDVPIVFIAAAQKKQMRLFVYGWMTYHDIFVGTPTRLNEFCGEIVNIKSSTEDISEPSAHITWDNPVTLCPEYNCNDEECRDYKERTKGK